MVARKRRPKPPQKLKTKIGQKIIFVQPFDLFFYLVVNLQHGKSMRLPAATTHERKYRI